MITPVGGWLGPGMLDQRGNNGRDDTVQLRVATGSKIVDGQMVWKWKLASCG